MALCRSSPVFLFIVSLAFASIFEPWTELAAEAITSLLTTFPKAYPIIPKVESFYFYAFFYLSRSWKVGTAVLSLEIAVIDDP